MGETEQQHYVQAALCLQSSFQSSEVAKPTYQEGIILTVPCNSNLISKSLAGMLSSSDLPVLET